MNTKLFNKLLLVWTGASLLLLLVAVFMMMSGAGFKTFFLLLTIINLFCLGGVWLFRGKIVRSADRLLAVSGDVQLQISYSHERKLGAVLICSLLAIGIFVLGMALFDVERYHKFVKEDGVAEYGSALFWLLAAIVSIVGVILRGSVYRFERVFSILLILFYIVCAGEEISWGQRILDIETPDMIKAINVQNEITLHNIGSISVFSNTFFAITLGFFLILPYLHRKNVKIRQVLDYLRFPVAHRYATLAFIITLSVWLIVGIRFGTLGFHPFSFYAENYYNQMDDEIFEFLTAYTFFCFSVFYSMRAVKNISE